MVVLWSIFMESTLAVRQHVLLGDTLQRDVAGWLMCDLFICSHYNRNTKIESNNKEEYITYEYIQQFFKIYVPELIKYYTGYFGK